jgi:hypothetical protein
MALDQDLEPAYRYDVYGNAYRTTAPATQSEPGPAAFSSERSRRGVEELWVDTDALLAPGRRGEATR